MRPKVDYRTASKESYETFCKNNPKIKVSFQDFKKVLYTYNALIANYALETGNKIKFPYGLGELVINKYKPKRFYTDSKGVERPNYSIDWQQTRKEGKYIYLLNSHTDGYKYYWMWNYWKSKIKHGYIWKLEMAREHSRMLKTYLKKPNSKYKDLYKQFQRVK